MTLPILPRPPAAWIDARTGQPTPEFYRWVLSLLQQAGGDQNYTVGDLAKLILGHPSSRASEVETLRRRVSDLETLLIARRAAPVASAGLPAIPNLDVLANISGASATPVGVGVSALLDAVFGNAQGDLLYRDSSLWKVLAPGTTGTFLQTQGAGANPQWAVPAGGSGGGLFNGQLSATPTQASTGLTNTFGSWTPTPTDTAAGIWFNSSSIAALWATPPATPYSITMLVGAGPTTTISLSVGWSDGTKYQRLNIQGASIFVQQLSGINTFNATNVSVATIAATPYVWFRLRDDGTTVYFMSSIDGVNFITHYSIAKSSGYLGSTGYNHIIVGLNPQQGTIMSWTQGS